MLKSAKWSYYLTEIIWKITADYDLIYTYVVFADIFFHINFFCRLFTSFWFIRLRFLEMKCKNFVWCIHDTKRCITFTVASRFLLGNKNNHTFSLFCLCDGVSVHTDLSPRFTSLLRNFLAPRPVKNIVFLYRFGSEENFNHILTFI
jgi:hypothetical protein